MNFLILAAAIIVILAVWAALKAKQGASSKDQAFTFDSRDTLFTPAERSFLGVLEQALDEQYRVFGKVRLGDLVKPAKGLSKSKRTTALNKINQKHLDFVICSATNLAVVGVVELDDQSHGREDRAGRDVFVDQALAGSKIPVARFSAKQAYAIPEVRMKLREALKLDIGTAESSLSIAEALPAPTTYNIAASTGISQGEEKAPVCPKCAAVMVKRQAKNGPHAGKLFWACSTYPKCRQVVAIEVA